MEPGVATARKSDAPRVIGTPLNHAQTVANACLHLRRGAHGKEGVNGSSPSEGLQKTPHVGAFTFSLDPSSPDAIFNPGGQPAAGATHTRARPG